MNSTGQKVNVSLLGKIVGVLVLWSTMYKAIRMLFVPIWDALTPSAPMSSVEKLQMYGQKAIYLQLYKISLFVSSLGLYYLVLRVEDDSSYPHLLTKQPIVRPFIKGFLWGALILISGVVLGLLFGGVVMDEVKEALLFSDYLWLFYNGGSIVLHICFFQFFKQFGQELFRGYALTRLERALGGLNKILLCGVLPAMVYMFSWKPIFWLSLDGMMWLLLLILCNYVYMLVRSIYFTTGLQLGFLVLQNFVGMKFWHSLNQYYGGILVGILLIAVAVSHYRLAKKEKDMLSSVE